LSGERPERTARWPHPRPLQRTVRRHLHSKPRCASFWLKNHIHRSPITSLALLRRGWARDCSTRPSLCAAFRPLPGALHSC